LVKIVAGDDADESAVVESAMAEAAAVQSDVAEVAVVVEAEYEFSHILRWHSRIGGFVLRCVDCDLVQPFFLGSRSC
jgi:hypothetical protein